MLELITEFSKVIGYKIHTDKSVPFLCANNEVTKREVKKITIVPKTITYLGINLTKDVKDLFSENYKTMMKGIKDDTNKHKNILCSFHTQYC